MEKGKKIDRVTEHFTVESFFGVRCHLWEVLCVRKMKIWSKFNITSIGGSSLHQCSKFALKSCIQCHLMNRKINWGKWKTPYIKETVGYCSCASGIWATAVQCYHRTIKEDQKSHSLYTKYEVKIAVNSWGHAIQVLLRAQCLVLVVFKW